MSERDRNYWERHAKAYDALLTVLLARPLPRMLQLIAEAVTGSHQVLEVAAGTGLVTPTLARAADQVTATDYAGAMVEMLSRRTRKAGLTNVRCEQADIYSLPFDSATFDVIVAANVLHLLPNMPTALTSLRRVLKPGGLLVLPTFCHDETWLSHTLSSLLAVSGFPAYRRFSFVRLCDDVTRNGLKLTHSEALPGLIPVGYVEGTFEAS